MVWHRMAVGGGYATALMSSVVGSDEGAQPTGLDSTGRWGCAGDNHCANGHTTLPLQLGQLAKSVKITSQSRQNNARSSMIGPWNRMSLDPSGAAWHTLLCRVPGRPRSNHASRRPWVMCALHGTLSKSKGDAMVRAKGEGLEDLADGGRERPSRVLSDGVVNLRRRCSSTGCQLGISCRASAKFSYMRCLSVHGLWMSMRH